MKLPLKYYQQDDVLFLSKDLLGKVLMTKVDGKVTGGIIIETEAYRGPEDRASHAYGGRKTRRNAVMYEVGGISYVYLCYGIHSLFNIVTNSKDIPHAILIRALQPVEGFDTMLKRRGLNEADSRLTSGPGSLTKALGICTMHNGLPLIGSTIWVEDQNIKIEEANIIIGPRIGIDYADEDALLPWRFRVKGSL